MDTKKISIKYSKNVYSIEKAIRKCIEYTFTYDNLEELNKIFDSDDICVIEWPEFIEDILPENRLDITILRQGPKQRQFVFRPNGNIYEDIVGELTNENNRHG